MYIVHGHTARYVVQDWSGMSDFIRREDAVYEALCTPLPCYGNNLLQNSMTLAKAIVNNIPSAEPEQKKGRWQRRKGSDCWECSQCHAVLENDDLGMHNFYFCYHCGANMMNKSGYMDIEEVRYE